MESHTLYVDNNCTSCKKIQQFIDEHKMVISSINIDEENYDLDFPIMIIPALIKEKKLIAYGPDIITFLKKLI